MFQGFYNLASGLLTQNRNLNVISNNMTNLTTPGYKLDNLTTTTFSQEMMYRNGNQNRNAQTPIGNVNMIRVPEQTVTNFEQGGFRPTGNNLDFAINGDGFFRVETEEGYAYTRNGAFYIDADSCLAMEGVGKVQGVGGEIFMETDDIIIDGTGGIYTKEGELIDNIQLVDFEDYMTLEKGANGIFTTDAEAIDVEAPSILNQTLEGSNASAVQVMQDMMTAQRSYQSASQMLKIYDQIMTKAVTEIGRV